MPGSSESTIEVERHESVEVRNTIIPKSHRIVTYKSSSGSDPSGEVPRCLY